MLSQRQVGNVVELVASRTGTERLAALSMPVLAALAVGATALHGLELRPSPGAVAPSSTTPFGASAPARPIAPGAATASERLVFATGRLLPGAGHGAFDGLPPVLGPVTEAPGSPAHRGVFGSEWAPFGLSEELARLVAQVAAPGPSQLAASARQAAPADRLRAEPRRISLVTEPEPAGEAEAASGDDPGPALSAEQRRVARFVAAKYRIALDDVQNFVVHAYQAAREFRLDPFLVLAIVSIESSFNPNARSSKGAHGLMQVLTRVHVDKFKPFGGASAAFDPVANLKVGSRILRDYLARHGSIEKALKSYVGAALLPHDFGYGRKVLGERERIAAAAGKPLAPAEPLEAQASKPGEVVSRSAKPALASKAEAKPSAAAQLETKPAVVSQAETKPAVVSQAETKPAAVSRTEAKPAVTVSKVETEALAPAWPGAPVATAAGVDERAPQPGALAQSVETLTDAPFEMPAGFGADHGREAVARLVGGMSAL